MMFIMFLLSYTSVTGVQHHNMEKGIQYIFQLVCNINHWTEIGKELTSKGKKGFHCQKPMSKANRNYVKKNQHSNFKVPLISHEHNVLPVNTSAKQSFVFSVDQS